MNVSTKDSKVARSNQSKFNAAKLKLNFDKNNSDLPIQGRIETAPMN